MKTFKQFLKQIGTISEAKLNSDFDEIMPILTGTFKFTGDNFLTKNKNYLKILVSGKNESEKARLEILKKIHNEIAKKGFEGWMLDVNKKELKKNKSKIEIKPESMQGIQSSGTCAEHAFVEIINYMLEKIEEMNDYDDEYPTIIFKGKNGKTSTYNSIMYANHAGQMTKGRSKSDVELVTHSGSNIPLSLKMDESENWESAESFLGPKAKELLDKVLADKKSGVKLEKRKDGQYHINPEIAIKLGAELGNDVMFGDDILNRGAVIIKSFQNFEGSCKKGEWKKDDFTYNYKTNTIIIKCSYVIKTLNDLPPDYYPYLFIRNAHSDGGRASKWFDKGARGIRPSVYYKKRASSNTHIVKGELK